MSIKRNLRIYMTSFPGSFVGFFNFLSEILDDLGVEWAEHSKDKNDSTMKEWCAVLSDASKSAKQISESLDKIRIEFDKKELESDSDSPASLIESFKNKIKEIKDGI